MPDPSKVVGAVPDVVAPPPHHPRFPLLDGMRAVAVLSVVVVHAAFFGELGDSPLGRLLLHLNIGVTIFFLISGFLLYRPFIAHRTGGGPAPGFGTYGRRRLLRILPAYWLILIALTHIPGLTGVSGGGGPWLAAVAVYAALALSLPPSPFLLVESDQVLTFIGFGLVAVLLMLPAVFADAQGGATRGFLSLRAISRIGLISYGIFLWHYVVTIELGYPGEGWSFLPLLIATLAITILVAAASYYLVKRPLLRFKRWRHRLPVGGTDFALSGYEIRATGTSGG